MQALGKAAHTKNGDQLQLVTHHGTTRAKLPRSQLLAVITHGCLLFFRILSLTPSPLPLGSRQRRLTMRPAASPFFRYGAGLFRYGRLDFRYAQRLFRYGQRLFGNAPLLQLLQQHHGGLLARRRCRRRERRIVPAKATLLQRLRRAITLEQQRVALVRVVDARPPAPNHAAHLAELRHHHATPLSKQSSAQSSQNEMPEPSSRHNITGTSGTAPWQ